MIQALISTLVYQAVCANAELAGTLWDFLLATTCLLVPMLPMIYLYKRVIGSQASVAAFIYALAPVPQEHVRFFDDELEHNERIRLHVLASLDKAIEETMRQAELPRELVRVEITESALNGSSTAMADAVRRFHELELEVWMDDFGSGYSSLNVLKDYDFDVIKIDMQFMSTFDERSRSIVRSVCEMTRLLGIRTVAEGVETDEQLAFLERIGALMRRDTCSASPSPPTRCSRRWRATGRVRARPPDAADRSEGDGFWHGTGRGRRIRASKRPPCRLPWRPGAVNAVKRAEGDRFWHETGRGRHSRIRPRRPCAGSWQPWHGRRRGIRSRIRVCIPCRLPRQAWRETVRGRAGAPPPRPPAAAECGGCHGMARGGRILP